MTDGQQTESSEKWRHALLFAGVVLAAALLILGRQLLEREPAIPLTAELPDIGPLPDFAAIRDVEAMKSTFFDYLLPVVEAQNEWILDNRQYLSDLQERLDAGEQLREADRIRLAVLGDRYRVDLPDPVHGADISALLMRVDIIPPSLALAQAASESGWGRSRFAREANNLFGEWCYQEGCGLVPARRIAGAQHEVTLFDAVPDAVDSYFRNLNSHPAYEPLRELRAEARREHDVLLGTHLIDGLEMYSERRGAYLDELRAMIRINRLLELDLPEAEAPEDDMAD
ncbi:MAG: glucosaminidase domain-containing protein [Gammaproteobacteria bacterium]|nr:glucosaminidase domain-containing protein [Gammaproteobacteria bacterium]